METTELMSLAGIVTAFNSPIIILTAMIAVWKLKKDICKDLEPLKKQVYDMAISLGVIKEIHEKEK